jgi:hypothetical protein
MTERFEADMRFCCALLQMNAFAKLAARLSATDRARIAEHLRDLADILEHEAVAHVHA